MPKHRFITRSKIVLLGFFVAACGAFSAHAETTGESGRFPIVRFKIEGNRSLPSDLLEPLVAPFTGPDREYGDIQRAVEAIEFAYRQQGYAAIQVHAPEQELTGGTVRLQVIEATVGRVIFDGPSRHFDIDNLRATLPALIEGTTPNAHNLSAQIALANENPAKQIEVVLGLGAQTGKVDARLKLDESNPFKIALNLDNTGSEQTGRHRLGVTVQHANLWNRDHVGTIAYQTSPEKPDQVSIYSLSYRLPVYAWAGAFDFILAKSTVNAGTTVTTAGNLDFAGSGTVFGLRYTHTLPREGDTTQKLVLGWDVKANDNTCTLGTFGAAGCGSAAADVTLRPLSLAYTRMQVAPGRATEFTASLATNLRGGAHGREEDFQSSRPGTSGGASADYTVLRGNLTHLRVFEGDWQARLAANAQWTPQPLLAQEQLGLAGSSTVRGFLEREVARDTGVQISVEGYTPSFADALGSKGNLRALAFLDAATGRNHLLDGETQPRPSLASWGLGLRYGAGKDVSAKLDVAQIITANGNQNRGDWRGHFSLMFAF
jgi:hemolysin activation/secretion protein